MAQQKKKRPIWLYITLPIMAVVILGLSLWWYLATNNRRKYKKDLEALRLYSQRQVYEIAIIEQAAKLRHLQREAKKIKPVYRSETAEPNSTE